MRAAMLGEGHFRMFGTLQIVHTIHNGHQRLLCSSAFSFMTYHGYNQEDFVFARPQGVERFVLHPVWSVEASVYHVCQNRWSGGIC